MIHLQTWQALLDRLKQLGVEDQDLEESFTLSGKRGGQSVNKTSSCVHLKHLPSGIEVKCQQYRSQNENRYHARKILADRLEILQLGKQSPLVKKQMKLIKQKKKRAKRAKAKNAPRMPDQEQ
jgi:protein subunit release factor B